MSEDLHSPFKQAEYYGSNPKISSKIPASHRGTRELNRGPLNPLIELLGLHPKRLCLYACQGWRKHYTSKADAEILRKLSCWSNERACYATCERACYTTREPVFTNGTEPAYKKSEDRLNDHCRQEKKRRPLIRRIQARR